MKAETEVNLEIAEAEDITEDAEKIKKQTKK